MITTSTLVEVIDLCGREPPHIMQLDDSVLERGDVDHILDMWADDRKAFIGEFEYRQVSAEAAERWMDGAS